MAASNGEAFDAIPAAVLVLSGEGSIVSANGHADALFGYESGELAGRPATELIPELRKDEKAQSTSPRELQAVRRDGNELIVEVSIEPDAEGEREVVLVRDVTAAVQETEAAREAEQRFRIAATHTAEVLHHANVKEDRLTWFGDVDGLTGYEPGGFPRTIDGWLEQIHPDDRERISADVERIIENGESGWSFRYRVRTKDGSYRHWFDRGSVTAFVDGRVNEGIGAVVDETDVATAREELEEALGQVTEQMALNKLILSSLHGQLAVLDQTGTIIAVNGRWDEFGIDNDAGVDARLGVGTNYLEACERAGTGDAQQALKGIRSVLGGSSAAFTMRYPCHSPSEKRWFSMAVSPMNDEGAIVVHTDVTKEVVAHQELERALREITQLKERLEAEGQYLQEEIKSSHNFEDIVGSSPELLTTLRKLEQVAETNATVLLQGETGTGKELLARATHARSKRSKRPLIKVDCTTLPPGLMESELFGHEKGAFTGAHQSQAGRFELAHRGTIFLDEVGELPLELQPKLLRVIQEGELQRVGGNQVKKVDVRVIAATNRNLLDEVHAGRFRADLYYRLNVFPVEVPPLRDRRQDVAALAAFFVAHKSRELGKEVNRIPPATMEALAGYDWPGNIRELQNVIERAIILSPGPDLLVAEALEPREGRPQRASGVLRKDLEALERQQILDALQASEWKIKGEGNAASRLGLKPSTLRSRMKRLGVGRQ